MYTLSRFKRKRLEPSPVQQKNDTRTTEERREVVGLATQTQPKGKGRGNSRDNNLTCTHCKFKGHGASGCFQLIGYPEWWGERPRIDSVGHGRGQAGGGAGRGRGGVRANAAYANVGTADVAGPSTATESGIAPGLSSED